MDVWPEQEINLCGKIYKIAKRRRSLCCPEGENQVKKKLSLKTKGVYDFGEIIDVWGKGEAMQGDLRELLMQLLCSCPLLPSRNHVGANPRQFLSLS